LLGIVRHKPDIGKRDLWGVGAIGPEKERRLKEGGCLKEHWGHPHRLEEGAAGAESALNLRSRRHRFESMRVADDWMHA
jgi:hypothetical protein